MHGIRNSTSSMSHCWQQAAAAALLPTPSNLAITHSMHDTCMPTAACMPLTMPAYRLPYCVRAGCGCGGLLSAGPPARGGGDLPPAGEGRPRPCSQGAVSSLLIRLLSARGSAISNKCGRSSGCCCTLRPSRRVCSCTLGATPTTTTTRTWRSARPASVGTCTCFLAGRRQRLLVPPAYTRQVPADSVRSAGRPPMACKTHKHF